MDSLRTTNFSNETIRLLAGSYVDPAFGTTQAQSIMQFKPQIVNRVIDPFAEYDSLVFKMRFDFYAYGSPGETKLSFDVFEIGKELSSDQNYFFNSDVPLINSSLGNTTVAVNREYFKEEFDDTNADSVITLKVKLNNSFGQRLFDFVNPEDVNFTDFTLFKSYFKGLAIVPQQADKIVGFNPVDVNSSLILYYHEGSEAKTLSFIFSQGVTFSKIISDRSSSELSGLSQYHTDYDPGLKRYLQGGSSVITKLDFTKFYEYFDTIPNMIINSAELELSDFENPSNFKAPAALSLSMLRSNNRYKDLKIKQDTIELVAFNGFVAIADQGKFFAAQDEGQVLALNYSSSKNLYNAFPTLFVQQLFKLKTKRYPYWALRPGNPQPGKSVDRLVFPKDKIKLKVYYTRATLDTKE